jgi:hypothetical protein
MIDKSWTEIAAVHQLELTHDAKGHQLCYFHFLQDWERFLRSHDSGVTDKEEQHKIVIATAHLAHQRDAVVFEKEVRCQATFKTVEISNQAS